MAKWILIGVAGLLLLITLPLIISPMPLQYKAKPMIACAGPVINVEKQMTKELALRQYVNVHCLWGQTKKVQYGPIKLATRKL